VVPFWDQNGETKLESLSDLNQQSKTGSSMSGSFCRKKFIRSQLVLLDWSKEVLASNGDRLVLNGAF
jgi:hypothetical protein